MSNNTNTLFWVITGAVIVLAVFTIISNKYDWFSQIPEKFNSYFTEVSVDEEILNPENSQDYSSYFPGIYDAGEGFTKVELGGSNTVYADGYKIGIYDLYTDNEGSLTFNWLIENTNESKIDGELKLSIYDCETYMKYLTIRHDISNIEAGEVITLYTNSSTSLKNVNKYFINAEIVKE